MGRLVLCTMPAGTVTALQAQSADPQRVNVLIDGEFALGISLATLAEARLYVGKVLSPADWLRLEQAEHADRALQAALRLLEQRPRSIVEMRERLQQKAFAPEQIEAALERLQHTGLLDDAAFARLWVENRLSFRPRGTGALRAELRRKGTDPALIAAALEDVQERDEYERALSLGRAALRSYAKVSDRTTFM